LDSLSKIVIDTQVFYAADDTMTKARAFKGNAKNARDMVRKREIPHDVHIYSKRVGGGESYVKTAGAASQDKTYLTEAYTLTIPELNPQAKEESEVTSDEGVEKHELWDYIELADHEKFRDDEGKVIEIETRGKRTCEEIRFRVYDVSSGFGILDLKDALIKKDRGYTRCEDYMVFACSRAVIDGRETASNASARKYLFLTYRDLMRVLFVTRSKKANKFIERTGSALRRSGTKRLAETEAGDSSNKVIS